MQLLHSNSSRVHPGPELEDDDSNSIESLCNIPGEDMRRTLHFKGEILQNNDTEGSSEDALDDVDQNATAALLRELMQYYGQGDEAIDEACRAALASVSSQEVNSARDCDGNSLLITCCQLGGEGVSDLIERLLNKGADPRVVNSAGASALHFASYHGDTITTELLLKYGGDPMEVEYIHGCTPLHYAASVGNMEVCEALILVGADIFAEDHHAYTASRYADDAGHTKLQDLLNKEGFLANEKKQERGIWRRHVDEATGAAYRYNSTTGECFWDEEVTTLAKERKTEEKQIPEAIQSWINQEKYRVSLTNLLARVDPRRIIEIDEIVEMAGNVSNLTGIIQSLKEEYKFDENKDTTHGDDEPHIDIARGEDDTIEGYMSMGNTKEQAGNEMNNKPDEELQAFEFQITEAEAKERDQRQEIEVLNKNLEAIRSKTKNAAIEVEGLQEHLNKIRAGSGEGGGERPQLESELDILKTSIQTETGTLEELKNALEIKQSEDAGRKSEMYATHKLDAEARQNRSRKMESDSAEEMARIEIEHSERMRSANLQYEIDLEEMNKEFYNRISVLKREKLEFEKESEKEILSITSAQDKLAASDDKQVAEKSKAYLLEMKEKIQHAHEAVRAYRAALATLIREADYSAALHNQLVDMKGSSRLMVKLKPSSNSAAAFVKDGSATVARVDKKPLVSFKVDAVTSEQSDLYTHIQPLAVSVTDGRTVALVVFSTRGSGKTYSLFGDGKTDSMFRKPGVSEQESICKTPDSPGSPRKTRRTKDDESDLIPVAGVIPRFLQTLFSTIEEREVWCAYQVSVAIAAVQATAATKVEEPQKHFLPLTTEQDNSNREESEMIANCWAETSAIPVVDPRTGTETIMEALAAVPADMHTAIKITCMNTRKEAPVNDPLLESTEERKNVSGPPVWRRDSLLGMESHLGTLLVIVLKDNFEGEKEDLRSGWAPVVCDLLKKQACAGIGNNFETIEPVAMLLKEVLTNEGAKTVALACVDPNVDGAEADTTEEMLQNLTRCRPSESDQEEALRCIRAQLKKIHLDKESGAWKGNSKSLKELPRPLAKSNK